MRKGSKQSNFSDEILSLKQLQNNISQKFGLQFLRELLKIISVFTDLYKCFLISCGLPDRTKLPCVSIFLKSAKAFKMCSSFIMTTTMKSIYQARTAPHEVYLHCHMGVLSKAAKILLQCNQQCTKVIIFCSKCVGIFFYNMGGTVY